MDSVLSDLQLIALRDQGRPAGSVLEPLQRLIDAVDEHWPEISDDLVVVEELADTLKDPKELAAANALASRACYHLEEYDDALKFALDSGDFFDVSDPSEYTSTMIGRCIEVYVRVRAGDDSADAEDDAVAASVKNSTLLENIVERMFDDCYREKKFEMALGVALEARRLDKVEEALRRGPKSLRSECLRLAFDSVRSRSYRLKVVQVLLNVLLEDPAESWLDVFRCSRVLRLAQQFTLTLVSLVDDSLEEKSQSHLIAYQVAFDVVAAQDVFFVEEVLKFFPEEVCTEGGDDEYDERRYKLHTLYDIFALGRLTALELDFLYKRNKTDGVLLRVLKRATETGRKNSILHHATVVSHGYLQAGTTHDSFLRDHLEWLGKASNWAKFSATASLGVVHKGNVTAAMPLLQPYLPSGEDGPSASPYSEGGALYALGLIHAAAGVSASAKASALEFLTGALDGATLQEEDDSRAALSQGACLGLGLVAMSSGNDDLLSRLINVLYQDSAVSAEGASVAMGLVLLGRGNDPRLETLHQYARDTKHAKIVRGVGLAQALAFMNREEECDAIVSDDLSHPDSLIRQGAAWTIGCAFVGTSDDEAVKRLLKIVVSDVSDDVRRCAAVSIGLVCLADSSELLTDVASLLSESYNAHVRYGAALALGIGYSASSRTSTLELLGELMVDKVDFVRQGALIATSMVLAHERPKSSPISRAFRDKLSKCVKDSKSSTMTRLGAVLGTGILDAGGRNASISLVARDGRTPKSASVAGMLLFLQYWNWYPFMQMLSLSFSPNALVGVNERLDLPKEFKIDVAVPDELIEENEVVPKGFREPTADEKLAHKKSKREREAKDVDKKKKKIGEDDDGVVGGERPAKKSNVSSVEQQQPKVKKTAYDVFGYPEDVKPEATKKKIKLKKKAVLSTTKKTTVEEAMSDTAVAAEEESKEEEEEEEEAVPKPEETFLDNPLRVTPRMAPFVRFRREDRYVPACVSEDPSQATGVIVLLDTRAGEPEDVMKTTPPPIAGDEEFIGEPDPPEPFLYTVPGTEEQQPDDPSIKTTLIPRVEEDDDDMAET